LGAQADEAWVAQRTAQIEVFYLPSYSPDLNPDKRLNADLKYTLGSRGQTRTKDKLKEAIKAPMDLLFASQIVADCDVRWRFHIKVIGIPNFHAGDAPRAYHGLCEFHHLSPDKPASDQK
jgi:hypothetical protein